MPDRIANQVGKYLSHTLRIKASHDRIGVSEYDRCVRLTCTQFLDSCPTDQIQLGGHFDNRNTGAKVASCEVDQVVDHTIRTPGTDTYLGSDVFFSIRERLAFPQ